MPPGLKIDNKEGENSNVPTLFDFFEFAYLGSRALSPRRQQSNRLIEPINRALR